jgi:thymidylate kinase
MIILFEGADLSGKSTTVEQVSLLYPNYKLRHQKLCNHNPVHAAVKELAKQKLDPLTIGHLYAESIRYDCQNFDAFEGFNVLQDSLNLLRSLAFHKASGNEEVVKHLETVSLTHPHIDLAFVFTANIKDRRDRLMLRFQ